MQKNDNTIIASNFNKVSLQFLPSLFRVYRLSIKIRRKHAHIYVFKKYKGYTDRSAVNAQVHMKGWTSAAATAVGFHAEVT